MRLNINKYKNNEKERIKITFNINKEDIETFKKYCKELNLNQSKLIEDMIKDINNQFLKMKEKNNTNNNTTLKK